MNHRNIVRKLLAWFARSARSLPWRRTRDPYAIWVSEVMLQQTQVKTVVPYWERWMRTLPTIEALARAKPRMLHKLWEGLGYYPRVRNLQRAAQFIREKHGGHFPRDFEGVLALPGIGRYTAGAICSIAFNQPKPILDGNVIRVLTRLYGIGGDPRAGRANARLWRLAEELVACAACSEANPDDSAGACSRFNQSLMELGALICTPRQPRCRICPLASHCVAYRQGRIKQLPGLSRRLRATPRRFAAFVVQKGSLFLVRQRPAGVVNAHLWEIPNLELVPGNSELRSAARRALGLRPEKLELLGTLKHSITRYRITLEAYRVTAPPGAKIRVGGGRWLSRRQLNEFAFTSAHRRILERLGIK